MADQLSCSGKRPAKANRFKVQQRVSLVGAATCSNEFELTQDAALPAQSKQVGRCARSQKGRAELLTFGQLGRLNTNNNTNATFTQALRGLYDEWRSRTNRRTKSESNWLRANSNSRTSAVLLLVGVFLFCTLAVGPPKVSCQLSRQPTTRAPGGPTTQLPVASSSHETTPETTTTSGAGGNQSRNSTDTDTTTTANSNSNNSNNNSNSNNPAKLKPVNFTLVDEMFESVLGEEEVARRWRRMDSQFQDGIRSILKMVFPQIVAISQDAKVSGDCSGGILKWILSLRNLRSWAIKMLDATGKPTAGIFEGSLTMFGNYRQCLGVRAPDEDEIEITEQFEEYFRGQFCVLHLRPWLPAKQPFYHLNSTLESLIRKNYKYYEKTLYDELAEIAIAFHFVDIRMDMCVPSTCTAADIQRVADLLSKQLEMRAKVMRCDIEPRTTGTLFDIDQVTGYWLILPTCVLLLVLVASISSAIVFCMTRGGNANRKRTNNSANLCTKLVQCFSIWHLFEQRFCSLPHIGCCLFSASAHHKQPLPTHTFEFEDEHRAATDKSQCRCMHKENSTAGHLNKPLPLYGLRSVFVLWFMLVQMTVELKYQYLRESLVLRNMLLSYWPFQIIINSTLLFESLIVITAFTFSYANFKPTFGKLTRFIVDKYARLTPAIVAVIVLTIATPLLAIESPVWRNLVESQSTACRSTGYLNLMFLQNFIPYDKICLPHTWLLCVEFQLIILSIPLMLLLKNTKAFDCADKLAQRETESRCKRNSSENNCLFKLAGWSMVKSRAGLLGILLIIVGTSTNYILVYTNKLPPSWFYTFPDIEQKNYYFGEYLAKTWTHLTVFVIGLYGGYICRIALQLRIRNFSNNLQVNNNQQLPPTPSSRFDSRSDLGLSNSEGDRDRSHGSTSTIMVFSNGKVDLDRSSFTSASGPTSTSGCRTQNRDSSSLGFTASALLGMMAIIFSTFTWSTQEAPTALVAALYDSLSRLFWSVALVGLMIQLCLPNNRRQFSTMAHVLSHPACIVLGRLSFLAYLISPYVHTFVLAVEEQSLFPSLFMIFHVIVGNIVITYILAIILAIVIEQPIRLVLCKFFYNKSSVSMDQSEVANTSEGETNIS